MKTLRHHHLPWKQIAPIQFTNFIRTKQIDQSFNEALTGIAITFFDKFVKSSPSSSHLIGNTSGIPPNPSKNSRRRRTSGKRTTTGTASTSTTTNYVVDAQTGLTTNDYFFEHQRINGYCEQLMSTPEILCLHDLLSVEVQEYFLSGIIGRASDNINGDTTEASRRKNSAKLATANDIVSRLQNDATVKLDVWATVQIGDNAYHADHIHENVFLSGVYYSSVPEGSSPLVLHRPMLDNNDDAKIKREQREEQVKGILNNAEKNNNDESNSYSYSYHNDGDQFVIHPEEGQVVLFPPWLLHGVPPSKKAFDGSTSLASSSPRVSFAFNVSGYSLCDPWEVTRP